MHGGQSRRLHHVPDTLGRSVYDGAHRHVVGVLPGVAVQVGHVLPDEPSHDTIISIIIQNLK